MIRYFTSQLAGTMEEVFGAELSFLPAFGGEVQITDGVRDKEKFFSFKESDVSGVLANYDKTKTVGNARNAGRFGAMKEVTYADVPAPYTWDWAVNEGFDRHTVNNDIEFAVADRIVENTSNITALMDAKHALALSSVATELGEITMTLAGVAQIFDDAFAAMKTLGVKADMHARVSPELYTKIVEHSASYPSQRSEANLGTNTAYMFKGFEVDVVPLGALGVEDGALFFAAGVGKAAVGIQTLRTLEAGDFDGLQLQGSGKAGEYIPAKNKKAVLKATIPTAP